VRERNSKKYKGSFEKMIGLFAVRIYLIFFSNENKKLSLNLEKWVA